MHAKSLYDSLVAAGSQMTDEELIEYILDGLGHDYKEFTTSLHLRSSLSFDQEDVFCFPFLRDGSSSRSIDKSA